MKRWVWEDLERAPQEGEHIRYHIYGMRRQGKVIAADFESVIVRLSNGDECHQFYEELKRVQVLRKRTIKTRKVWKHALPKPGDEFRDAWYKNRDKSTRVETVAYYPKRERLRVTGKYGFAETYTKGNSFFGSDLDFVEVLVKEKYVVETGEVYEA